MGSDVTPPRTKAAFTQAFDQTTHHLGDSIESEKDQQFLELRLPAGIPSKLYIGWESRRAFSQFGQTDIELLNRPLCLSSCDRTQVCR